MIIRPQNLSIPTEAERVGARPRGFLIVDTYSLHEHAIKKHIRNTKDSNVRDRLRLVGDVQEGMSITTVSKKLGMSQPWGPSSRRATRLRVLTDWRIAPEVAGHPRWSGTG